MTVGTMDRSMGKFGLNRPIALGIWSIGVWATHLFVSSLGVSAEWSWYVAIVLQAAITAGQSAFWHGRYDPLSVSVLALDTSLNYGGLGPYLRNLPNTAAYQEYAFSFPFVPYTPPMWFIAIISLVLAALIAGLPERIWRA